MLAVVAAKQASLPYCLFHECPSEKANARARRQEPEGGNVRLLEICDVSA